MNNSHESAASQAHSEASGEVRKEGASEPALAADLLTLRDYFMAHAPITVADAIQCCGFPAGGGLKNDAERCTTFAVLTLMRREYADAMMAERLRNE